MKPPRAVTLSAVMRAATASVVRLPTLEATLLALVATRLLETRRAVTEALTDRAVTHTPALSVMPVVETSAMARMSNVATTMKTTVGTVVEATVEAVVEAAAMVVAAAAMAGATVVATAVTAEVTVAAAAAMAVAAVLVTLGAAVTTAAPAAMVAEVAMAVSTLQLFLNSLSY